MSISSMPLLARYTFSRELLENPRSTPLIGSTNDSRFASNCNGAE